ncbi:autotransporter-associated beta strand repeat-containing protein [Bradyrhizobium sp.]|uniref:autotransporter-associated beta strand repeat-containing protein n=1 Tax=Bradyrhizobium sp. TaxID=376 RepID=UPI002DFE6CE8|nr:autotransporter-associated beta strand repeat-containing protein [Bradyrhizobium sp.]
MVAIGIVSSSAQAQDATWNFAPGSSDYNTPANWTPMAAPIGPSGTASFGASGTTSLTFSTGTTVDTFQFNAGAPAYTFGLSGHFLEFTANGIVNNSSNAPTINAFGLLQFDNTATAGNAIINNTPGSTTFTGFSTAGTATITNSGGLLSFTDSSNAGSSTITTNAGSLTQFSANSDGGNARFATNGSGIVDFSNTAGFDGFNIITAGSIAGSGRYFLGNNIVHVGGNGDTTTVSGVISACGPTGNECSAASGTSGGSLFKEGTGTLTLSGVNTYTGSTVVNGGTLLIAGAGTLGATTAQLQVLAGTLDLGGTTQVTGELSTFGGSIVNGALNSTAYTLAGGFISANLTGGAVTQDGLATTLSAANTYTGGTVINSGTLEAAHASGGTIDALSSGTITVNSAGALRSSVNGTLGNDITFNNGSLSAAAGTTLTLTGGIFLNSDLDSVTTFGNSTDTGTVLVDPTGISASSSASIVVGGGTLRAGSFQLGSALGTIQSTAVNAGATLDLNDFSAAIHNLGGAGSVVTGTFGNTNLSLVVDPATSSEFSGVISGAGTVSVTGGGTMILSGDNTYGNGTPIMASTTLQIGNGGATGSIVGDALNGGTLVFNRSNTITFAGVISDFSGDGPASAGSLVQNGTGTTILTANNTYTGGTTINAGTLQLGNGGTTSSIPGNVLNNGTFAINHSDAFAFGGVISGTGAFQQLGAGTTTLTAVQTYQGSTTISAGVLALTGSAGIAASSGVVANAKFDISGLSAGTSITTLSGGSAGTVALGNNTLTLTNAAGAFAGVISGGGGLVKQGSGLFILSGANGYTGATTVADGNLRVNGSVASPVTVQSGATLSGIGSVGGLVTVQSGGTLSAGQSPGTITLGALNLDAGSTSVFELGSAGVVGGATDDLVNVTGNLTLGGTLSVNAPSAGYYRLFNYGTLTPSNFDTITGSSNGTPVVLTNVANQVNLSIAAAGQRLQFWDGADQTGNGVVNGGTGTWNATNTNWTGAPGQAATNDQWRSSVGVFTGTAGTVTVAGAQAFDTLQFSTTGYVLDAGAGGQLQLAGLSGTGTINTDNAVVATINAPIVNGSSQSLAKVGGGTLILAAANTYTGGTTISGGTLQLGNGGAGGSIVGDVINNGTFAINHSVAFIFGGVISGTGAFNQIGVGTTTLTALETYSGLTTISAGTLALTGAGSIANSSGVVANSVFDISGVAGAGTSVKSLSGSGSVALGAKTLTLSNAAGNFAGSIGGSGGLTLAAGTQTLSGVNGYTGATTITAGTLALAGAGSIANSSGVVANGAFDISGLSGAGTSIQTLSGSGSVALGAKILTLTNASGNFAGAIGGTGGVTLQSGTETLSGVNGYGDLTTIAAGTLTLSGAGSIASSSGVLANGTLDISSVAGAGTSIKSLSGSGSVALGTKTLTLTTASGNFAGVIGGTGGFTLAAGTETLSGTNTYTGGTTISGGTLNIAAGGSITSNVNNTATFSNAGTVTGNLFSNGTASNTGTITNGVTNVGGTTTNSGTINGGVSNSGAGTLNTTATSVIAGGLINAATVNAQGQINGPIQNNTNILNVIGDLSSDATLRNGSNGTLNVNVGTYTVTGAVTNFGVVNVAAGATLTATAAGITNGQLGSGITNKGTINGALTNNGQVSNDGTYNADVTIGGAGGIVNNATGIWNGNLTANLGLSHTTNNGVWNGNAQSNDGTINNNLIWNGTISNIGTVQGSLAIFNNNAAGTVSGLVTNAGTTTNSGALNGGLSNIAGTTTNSGTINGGATIRGGTLNTNTATSVLNGGLTNSATVNAAGIVNGAIANNAGIFTTTGTLTSNSTFTNAAGATLAIGAATYTLQGLLTNSGALTVANGATLDATTGGVTNNAGGSITVAAGGTVKDDLNNASTVVNNGAYIANVATNTNAGNISNAATGTWTGNVLGNTNAITNSGVWTGNVASNAGTISNNLTWTGTVSNAGAFNNNAGATVSGLLTNTAGTTVNNGALNGGANVSGGTFAGSGTVTNLTVSGGIFAPGNGTPGSSMTVAGNLAFQSGAMYLVALNPATASFASVGGTASLNGSAAAVYLAGNYVSKKYAILTAAGGISGTFGPLVNTNVPANFTSSLSCDANNAYINLTLNFVPNPAPNFGSGLNVNQQNVANTLVNFFNSTGGIPLAFGALTPAGLTQASGELGTGVIASSIKANDMFLNLLLDPSVAGRTGGFVSSPVASQFAADDEALAYAANRKASSAERAAYALATKAPYLAPQPVNRWSVWGAAYGGSATTDGNTTVGSHDTTARAYGVVGGADYKVSPDALIGFALAGGGTNFSIASALGSGNSDLFQAGVFGRQNIGAAYLSGALAYGWQDVTTNRTVTIAGADVLQARFKAETFSARFEGGYRFATPLAGITPYVAAQAVSFNLPAYAEQVLAGIGTFALNYGAQTTAATRTELGLRGDKSFAVQDGIFTLRGRAAWAHDYNNDRAVTAVFQTLPGAAFVVNGARANPDGALVSAGAEMKWLSGFSLAATFEGEFSGNVTSYAGKGVARYTW